MNTQFWSRYDRHFVGITGHNALSWVSCYSNKIKVFNLRKCPYDHWRISKAYLNDITVTNILKSFTYKMAAKINWHKYATKLRHSHPMYSLLSPDFQSRSFPVASRGKSRGFQDPKSTNKIFVAWEHKAVGRRTCDQEVADSTPGRDVATDKAGGNHVFKVGGSNLLVWGITSLLRKEI